MTGETNAFVNILKTDKDGAEMTSAGRSFHRGDVATPKARSPAVLCRDRRIRRPTTLRYVLVLPLSSFS